MVFGEVSLSGEVRPVGRSEARLREAAKLGFDRALAPSAAAALDSGLRVSGASRLAEVVDRISQGAWD